MDEARVREYLHGYMWLTVQAEEVVVDFIRQSRLGEGPRLLAHGRKSTGKTRLGLLLMALLKDVVVMDDLQATSPQTPMLARSVVTHPIFGATNNRTLAELWPNCPVIFLPVVRYDALIAAGIPAAVSESELIVRAQAVWSL